MADVKETGTTEGKSFTLGGGNRTSSQYAKDVSSNDDAIAAAEAQARGESVVDLPEGVSPDALKSLQDAGFSIEAPVERGINSPPIKDPSDDIMDRIGSEGLNEEQEEPQEEAQAPQESSETLEGLKAEKTEEAVPVLESMQEFSKEWADNDGILTEETRNTLKERHNVDDEALDFFMSAVQNQTRMGAEDALRQAGVTVDDFTSWEQWSADNEDDETREARWEIMKSANVTTRNMGVASLKDAYAAANSEEASLIRGGASTRNESFDAILSRAMNHPLYERRGIEGDAYRAEIDKQLHVAKAAKH